MKLSQRFFILGSSLFTFFCFCLPWIDDESGFHLIVGESPFLIPFALLVTFMTIGCIFFWQSKTLIFGCSWIGVFLLMIFLFNNLLFIEYGLSLTIVGFFLTIAGVSFFPKPE